LRDEAAQATLNIGSLVPRRHYDRDLRRPIGWRRFGWLKPWPKVALVEGPHQQPNHDHEPNRRQQKVQGSTGQAAMGFAASILGGSFGFRDARCARFNTQEHHVFSPVFSDAAHA
jgi:hypothetical protein